MQNEIQHKCFKILTNYTFVLFARFMYILQLALLLYTPHDTLLHTTRIIQSLIIVTTQIDQLV